MEIILSLVLGPDLAGSQYWNALKGIPAYLNLLLVQTILRGIIARSPLSGVRLMSVLRLPKRRFDELASLINTVDFSGTAMLSPTLG